MKNESSDVPRDVKQEQQHPTLILRDMRYRAIVHLT